jgi:hypothetical protein
MELFFPYKALWTFLTSLDVVLEAVAVSRKEAGDLPCIFGPCDIDGRHHVEKGLNGIRACKLDQSHLISKLEFVRRHSLIPSLKNLPEQ